MKKILVTGGAGYIGSHTTLALLNQGYEVVVVDNFCNSCIEPIKRVEKLSDKKVSFYEVDLMDETAILDVLQKENDIDAVIHFAGLKAVGESVEQPIMYYENNITGTLNLLKSMKAVNLSKIVFSSSATVYGDAEVIPCKETNKVQPTNPYGQTKLMMEQILTDLSKADNWDVTILRYFNPVGAHPSGEIGEDPKYPNNLLPFVQQVAAGIREKVMIFGDDYDTPDGTGVRDYIHVMDLATAHVAAVRHMDGLRIYNVGTGRGYSVIEMINAFRTISGQAILTEVAPRRTGDVASLTADASLILKDLNWQASLNLNDMVTDAWKWQSQNPKGFLS